MVHVMFLSNSISFYLTDDHLFLCNLSIKFSAGAVWWKKKYIYIKITWKIGYFLIVLNSFQLFCSISPLPTYLKVLLSIITCILYEFSFIIFKQQQIVQMIASTAGDKGPASAANLQAITQVLQEQRVIFHWT